MGTRTVGRTVATVFAGAGKMVGSFLTLAVLDTAVGATLDGLGGAGRMAGRGLDLTCVVTVGADSVICAGDGLGQTVAKAEDGLVSFLEES